MLSEEYTLANGMPARFEMPDMQTFANGSFDIPNQAQDDIFELIYGGGFSLEPIQRLNLNRQKMRGLYALAAIVIAEPKMVLDDEDVVDGALNVWRALAWGDVLAAHAFFRYGPPKVVPAAESEKPSDGTESPPSSDDVPQAAE